MNRRNQNIRSQGAALLIFVFFFLMASAVLTIGIGRGVYRDYDSYRVHESGIRSFFAGEAGIEDAIYRHRDGRGYSNTETFSFMGATVSTTRTLIVDSYRIVSLGDVHNAKRSSEAYITVGDGASFNFGLQSGNGGITLSNSSSVIGNVFSNGTVQGAGSAIVRGDVISAGSSGLINSIHATGSAWAHTIQSSTIDTDAYYQTITGSVVSGGACVNAHCHPGSTDQATATMPIPDSMIEDWKVGIETSGTLIASSSAQCSSGTYIIDTDTVLGNVKIGCNVELKKKGSGTTITFTGPVWIEGNLLFSQGPTIVASSSLGTRSVQVIVDKENNHATGSTISVNQSTNFISGNALSYIVLISMNTSAEGGGTTKAIDLAQSSNGKLLVYAPHGLIDMGNNISLKEVTAHQIEISNGAQVIYESGLMSLLFTGGPGGGYTITSWEEIE